MKRQIRRGTFETNSSSVHAISFCMESEYDGWKNGELLYDRWEEKLIPVSEVNIEEDEDHEYLTYEQFHDWEIMEYETYEERYTTPNGETVVAVGYYGHD